MRRQLTLPFTAEELHGDQREYLLIASPGRNLTAKVMKEKERFFSVYQQRIAIDTWPHITVATFKAKQSLEGALVEIMQEVCHHQRKFIAVLQDFDGFEHSTASTVYIKVQQHAPFRQLSNGLYVINSCLRAHGCQTAYLVNTPHLTIARRIPYQVYLKAIQEYSQRRFDDSFLVDSLLLLRRRHPNDTYKRAATLCLSSPSNYFLN